MTANEPAGGKGRIASCGMLHILGRPSANALPRYSMRISADSGFRCVQEQRRLVRKYISEQKGKTSNIQGLSRWFARLRLQVEAWKYADQEMKKHGHGPHSLYSSR
jgi:hypothetical protein